MGNFDFGTKLVKWRLLSKYISLLLEGEVSVTLERGEPMKFSEGDLVVSLAWMKCKWDVHKAVCKHYRFGVYTIHLLTNQMRNISKIIAISIVAIFVLSAFAGLFGTLLSS